MKPLNVAIDYDYALRISTNFIHNTMLCLKASGHKPFFVSSGADSVAARTYAEQVGVGIIFTQGHAQDKFLNVMQVPVDIWVHSNIKGIIENHELSPLTLDALKPRSSKVHIGMDYDGTYNRDPVTFGKICDYGLQKSSHFDVRLVTARYDTLRHVSNKDLRDNIRAYNPNMKCHFTQLQGKNKYLEQLRMSNFMPHIWFDDEPTFILRSR